ncbi:hypothetical protein HYH02_000192 [Chlamydomonas schloesseri]|uniref:3CxxC-type domain-containing protein n=1 Tax=Chlamydomonas schloesseri TaxID=2026947 RepID=A0A835WLR3_9CHLO|nr:hypothetical protein HYH02_000192 [Chlamydomonas schloesseri]|eukprot:KAG2450088.1 hypothetical protein HYH02_000192 [Chlamydomonas schloesseri]
MVLVLPSGGPLPGPATSAPGGQVDTAALLRAILADPAIQGANEAFLGRLKDPPVPATCRSACTMMGEEALVDFSSCQWHVGSADATTCLIVAVVCPVTRKAWAAHYNSSLVRRDTSIRHLLPAVMQQPHAYLVGSFREGSGESAATLAGALAHLHACPLAFRLRLACVGTANTDPATGGPRAINLALRCGPPVAGAGGAEGAGGAAGEGGAAAAAAWQALAELPDVGEPGPSGFEDRGPEVSWRLVRDRLVARDGAGSHDSDDADGGHEDSDGEGEGEGEYGSRHGAAGGVGAGAATAPPRGSLCPIVDTATGRLLIPGHRVRRLPEHYLMYFTRMLSLPDQLFLQYGSTSPDYEPPHFVDDFRKAYGWILQLARAGVEQLETASFEWASPAGGAGGVAAQVAAGAGANEDGKVEGKVVPGGPVTGWRKVRGDEGAHARVEGVAAGGAKATVASGNSWANTGQQCKSCMKLIYPYSQRPLEKRDDDEVVDLTKPHPAALCGKCQQLGYPCTEIDRDDDSWGGGGRRRGGYYEDLAGLFGGMRIR